MHPTEDQLSDMAGHVGYELAMLRHSSEAMEWLKLQSPESRAAFHNMFLEAFLLHARNLAYFFYKFDDKRDIHAQLYAPKWSPQPSVILEDLQRRANKQLAHLTVERITFKPIEWDRPAILTTLMSVYRNFLSTLSAERRLWFPVVEGGDDNGDS